MLNFRLRHVSADVIVTNSYFTTSRNVNMFYPAGRFSLSNYKQI